MQQNTLAHIYRELSRFVDRLSKREVLELEGKLTVEHDLVGISLQSAQIFP
jgi:hypothetical protein